MKAKICNDNLTIRHGMNENENLKREIFQLRSTIDLAAKENEDLKQESLHLKELIHNTEKDKIMMTSEVYNKDKEIFSLRTENDRIKSLLQTHQNAFKDQGPP